MLDIKINSVNNMCYWALGSICYKLTAIVLFTVIIGVCDAQDGPLCQTPLGERGNCINIKLCGPLVEILEKEGATDQVTTLLRNSACGWDGDYPLVCCPQRARASPPPPLLSDILPRPPHCGFNNISKGRIVNGVPAKLGEYPWIVALGYRNSKNLDQPKWLCGGTLITDRHVLTAGHCVHNRPDLYLARLGELDLYSDDDGAFPTNIGISKAKVHEEYNPSSYSNDIAILTLAEKHTNPTVRPICLPVDEPLRSNSFVGYSLFVAGWGALFFNGPSSSELQTTMVPVVTNQECSADFVRFRTITVDQRVLCAGLGGKDACQGDSGGPLMYGKGENKVLTFYQTGVVSFGFRCAEENYPGVYTRVTAFLDWITNNLN